MESLDVICSDFTGANWKKNKWRWYEEATWKKEVSEMESLQYYPKSKLRPRMSYIEPTKRSIALCRMRLGDLLELKDRNKKCILCSETITNCTDHIWKECNNLKEFTDMIKLDFE